MRSNKLQTGLCSLTLLSITQEVKKQDSKVKNDRTNVCFIKTDTPVANVYPF